MKRICKQSISTMGSASTKPFNVFSQIPSTQSRLSYTMHDKLDNEHAIVKSIDFNSDLEFNEALSDPRIDSSLRNLITNDLNNIRQSDRGNQKLNSEIQQDTNNMKYKEISFHDNFCNSHVIFKNTRPENNYHLSVLVNLNKL